MKNIIFVTQHSPFPPISGARVREFELIKIISTTFKIHLCVISKIYDFDITHINKLYVYCESVKIFPAKKVPLPGTNGHRPVQVLRNVNVEAQKYIEQLCKESDISLIHIEGYFLLQLVKKSILTPIVLVDQNVEYLLWKQKATSNLSNMDSLLKEYKRVRRTEIEAWKRATEVIAVTPEDKDVIQKIIGHKLVSVVTNGYDHLLQESKDGETKKGKKIVSDLLFIANFDYYPNEDAVSFFMNSIFPLLQKRVHKIKILLVGNLGNSKIGKYANMENISVTGYVDFLNPYFKNSSIFICPLRIGGGIKTKMLEAIAHGKAIVTTSIGCQGLPLTDNIPFIIADDAEEFANAIYMLLQNKKEKIRLELNCAKYLKKLPNWHESGLRLIKVYNRVIKNDV